MQCSPSKLASLEEWDRVFDENCTRDMDDVHQAFATFFVVLIEKHCVLPRPEHFVEEIFRQYNAEGDVVIGIEGKCVFQCAVFEASIRINFNSVPSNLNSIFITFFLNHFIRFLLKVPFWKNKEWTAFKAYPDW